MPRAIAIDGTELEYETIGSPTDPPVLLIMGLTAQLIAWPDGFVQAIVDAGRFVIRFDNRDCGLSSKHDGVEVDATAVIMGLLSGNSELVRGKVPYTLSDMANDACAVLDALGIVRAHIVGASLGGMIAQTLAIDHPDRVLTLTSIMSMTGEVGYGDSTPEAQAVILAPAPTERAAFIARSTDSAVWASKRYVNLDSMRDQAARSYDRSFTPEGSARQLAAIVASGSRGDLLPVLRVPTLVIHGLDDQLITPGGGERTAALIPDSTLLLVEDMGHDLPEPLWPTIVGALATHTALVS